MDYTSQQYNDTYTKLRQVAAAQQTIGYQELSDTVGLGMDMHLANDRRRIGVLLGAISLAEHEAGRPMLSAVVVYANGPLNPGPGFFECARSMVRKLPAGAPEQPFFQQELAAVHHYWAAPTT